MLYSIYAILLSAAQRTALNMPRYEIDFYILPNGRKPAQEYLLGLSCEERVHMNRRIGHLEELGPDITKTNSGEFIGDNILVLRARCHRIRLRLFCWRDDEMFILSHGIRKRSSKIRTAEIDKAIKYRRDYFARKRRGKR